MATRSDPVSFPPGDLPLPLVWIPEIQLLRLFNSEGVEGKRPAVAPACGRFGAVTLPVHGTGLEDSTVLERLPPYVEFFASHGLGGDEVRCGNHPATMSSYREARKEG